MPRSQFSSNQVIGPWRLLTSLGSGGSGEVWKALDTRAPSARRVALKLLRRPDPLLYERFRREVRALGALGDITGVLPLIEAHTPERWTKDLPWIAMPIARQLATALPAGDLERAAAAVGEVAGALTLVHERGYAHRDVKPGNLYHHNGRAAIGDFGLVRLPDIAPITTDERKLGPQHFYAPEMLREPARADGRLADVYSLAKTFWVLATGQRYPPEGDLRLEIGQVGLRSYVDHPRVVQLDRLLDRSTRRDPAERPTMAEFSAEVHAWLEVRTDRRETPPESVTDILATIDDNASVIRAVEARLAERATALRSLYEAIRPVVVSLKEPFAGSGLRVELRTDDIQTVRDSLQLDLSEAGGYHGVTLEVVGPGESPVVMRSMVGVVLRGEMVEIHAAYGMFKHPRLFECEIVFRDMRRVPIGSAVQERALDEVMGKFTAALRPAVEVFGRRIEEQRRLLERGFGR